MKKFKWSEDQINALKKSIKKWERIVAKTDSDRGTENCECCKKWNGDDCEGCPICEFSGNWCCRNTPYKKWTDATKYQGKYGSYINRSVKKSNELKLAKEELAYLKQVLEAGIPKKVKE